MNAAEGTIPWRQIYKDDDSALGSGIIGGISPLELLVVTLLTAYRLERSLNPARDYA